MTTQTPTVGRIVHYQPYPSFNNPDPAPQAAMVTAALGSRVSLAVFAPGQIVSHPTAEYSEEPTMGCWNWPPRA